MSDLRDAKQGQLDDGGEVGRRLSQLGSTSYSRDNARNFSFWFTELSFGVTPCPKSVFVP